MAEKYGMKLIKRLSFADYFKENIEKGEARSLISRMQALEVGKSCNGIDRLLYVTNMLQYEHNENWIFKTISASTKQNFSTSSQIYKEKIIIKSSFSHIISICKENYINLGL